VPVSQIDDFEHGARIAVWAMASLLLVCVSLSWCVATTVLFYPFTGYDGDRGCVEIDQRRFDWSVNAWRMSILVGFFPSGLLLTCFVAWIFTRARAWPAYLRFILHSLRHTRVWYGSVLVAVAGLTFLERFADAGLFGSIGVFAVFAFALADTLSIMPRVPRHFLLSVRLTVGCIGVGALLSWVVIGLEQSLCDHRIGRRPETLFDQMVITVTQSALSLLGAKYMRRSYVKLRNPRGPSYDLPSTEGLQGPWGDCSPGSGHTQHKEEHLELNEIVCVDPSGGGPHDSRGEDPETSDHTPTAL
jgi:hypothetical protein